MKSRIDNSIYFLIYQMTYLRLCFGKALSSTATILDTNTITGDSLVDEHDKNADKVKKKNEISIVFRINLFIFMQNCIQKKNTHHRHICRDSHGLSESQLKACEDLPQCSVDKL